MEIIDLWSGDEWLPVELITENTGIIKGISINPEFGFGDMVLFNFQEKEITQLIKKNSKTVFFAYEIPYNNLDKDWNKIEFFFQEQRLHIQKHNDGLFFLAIPVYFNDEHIENIIDQCPVKCFKINPEEIYDSEEDDNDDEDFFYLN